jgi:hypothetical protein
VGECKTGEARWTGGGAITSTWRDPAAGFPVTLVVGRR